jgi:hypothetical protein
MTELEQALVRLGTDLEFPETPDVAGAVRRRLAERPRRRRLPLLERRTLAVAFALFVVAVGLAMAVPPARTAILEFLHLRGATVHRVETLPQAPDRLATPLELGRRTSLETADRRARFAVLVPEELGDPEAVYYSDLVPGGKVSLVYRPRDGLPASRFTSVGALVTEFRGDLAPELVDKLVDQTTRFERLSVNGFDAVWLEGGPHVVMFRTPNGEIGDDRVRLAGNTLLVQHGRVLVRIEGTMTRDRAVALAESLGRTP